MSIQTIVDAINDYQYEKGQESGIQQDQLMYTEIVETGENIVSFETRAYSNDTKKAEFSIITENGKVKSINEL